MGLARVCRTEVRGGKPEVFSDWAVVPAQK
jgi:hypothetical protein